MPYISDPSEGEDLFPLLKITPPLFILANIRNVWIKKKRKGWPLGAILGKI
jgi:hypothetical protein